MTPALITAAGTALVAIIGAAAKAIVDIIKAKNNSDIEFQKAILRATILNTYFDYRDQQAMPETQFESVCSLFEIYKNLGGNGATEDKFNKMKQWDKW